MRIGLVGVGRVGALHAATPRGLDTVDQVVMADAGPARAQAAAKELDGDAAADLEALLRADLDGVAICAPASSHGELIAGVQDAGLTTFCEKPVASDLASTLLTGANAPYIPTSGGFYRDCSIHDVDTVWFVTGREVVSVFVVGQSRGAAFFAESDDVDAAAAVLTMDGGTIALISGSHDKARGYGERLQALGSNDSVSVEMVNCCLCARSSRGWTFSRPCPTPTLWIGSTKPMSTSWSRSPTSSPAGSRCRARPRRPRKPWRPCGLPRHATSRGEKAAPYCWKRWAREDDREPRGGGAADQRCPRQYGAGVRHCKGTSMNAGPPIHTAGPRAAALDVLTIGRVGVDLYPLQSGTRLQDVETSGRFLGGSPTNVAVAAARHRRRTAVIIRTGRDPFGEFIHQALRDLAVDDRYVSAVDGLPKQGPTGVLAPTRPERVEVAAFPVEVVNELGAGDALGGALCHGLLTGWPLERVQRFANVAEAIVASRLECSTAVATDREVEGRMGQQLIGELQISNDEASAADPWPLDCSTEVRHE